MAKAKANGILSGVAFKTVEGKTSISSANGPKVANNLAPLTTIPLSVSLTTWRATFSENLPLYPCWVTWPLLLRFQDYRYFEEK